MHDNLLPFIVEENGQAVEQGGYARLQTVINQERTQDPDLILVDAGDFSMGTLFQTIFSQDAPGLRLLGRWAMMPLLSAIMNSISGLMAWLAAWWRLKPAESGCPV